MERQPEREHDRAVWKGVVAGAAGGLAGAWTMNLFQAGLSKLSSGAQEPAERGGDDATVKAAEAVSEAVAGHRLSRREKKRAGPAVHYGFGALMGALYGAATEYQPRGAAGWGSGFATALWAGADEIGVPALGLSGPPWRTPVSTHASALTAHIVYGATVESVRRAVRAVL